MLSDDVVEDVAHGLIYSFYAEVVEDVVAGSLNNILGAGKALIGTSVHFDGVTVLVGVSDEK